MCHSEKMFVNQAFAANQLNNKLLIRHVVKQLIC